MRFGLFMMPLHPPHRSFTDSYRRDVDQIIRDLLEAGIGLVRDAKRKEVEAKAQLNAEERVIDALVGANANLSTRDAFRKRLRAGELDDREIEIQVADTGAGMPAFEIPGMPGSHVGMINLSDVLGKALPQKLLYVKSFFSGKSLLDLNPAFLHKVLDLFVCQYFSQNSYLP